jgi:hypothetical protein
MGFIKKERVKEIVCQRVDYKCIKGLEKRKRLFSQIQKNNTLKQKPN